MNTYQNKVWSEGTPSNGDRVLYIDSVGGKLETFYYKSSKFDEETKWQDSELRKYDTKLQPDRPNATRILEYREELRQYILHVDFPNGTRPIL